MRLQLADNLLVDLDQDFLGLLVKVQRQFLESLGLILNTEDNEGKCTYYTRIHTPATPNIFLPSLTSFVSLVSNN